MAALAREGADLGAWSLTPDMPEGQPYREVLAFVHAQMPDFPSIVPSSVLDAVEGHFGDHHSLDPMRETRTIGGVTRIIEAFRAELPEVRPWENIPL
ncbi:hypothetical protein [Deinococcus hopiensis]|uniref:hypothetical protein n=1 Tax=Deinococcus hopiensis TaxID=309885 RepID=UPI000A03D754|nr:hypothetical protein [Deinococcus hopiensis]